MVLYIYLMNMSFLKIIKRMWHNKEDKDVSKVNKKIKDESLSKVLKELDSRHRLIELDLERRLVVLENEIDNINQILTSFKDFDTAKEVLENTREIKEKIRDLEDLKYVEHLEVENLNEKVKTLEKDVEDLVQKFGLLEEAIKNLPNLKDAAKIVKVELNSIKKAISSITQTVNELQTKQVSKEEILKLHDNYAHLKGKINELMKDVKDAVNTAREYADLNERRAKEIDAKIIEIDEFSRKIKEIEDRMDKINKKINIIAENLTLNEKANKEKFAMRRFEKALKLLEHQIKELEETRSTISPKLIKDMEEKIRKLEEIEKNINRISEGNTVKSKAILSSYLKDLEDIKKRYHEHETKLSKLEKDVKSIHTKLKDIVDSRVSVERIDKKIKEMEDEIEKKMKSYKEEIRHLMNSEISNLELKAANKEELLSFSKNIVLLIDKKVDEVKAELFKQLNEIAENNEKHDNDRWNELIETIKSQLWDEMLAMIASQEVGEEIKAAIMEEVENKIKEEIERMMINNNRHVTKLMDEILKDIVENKKEELVKLKIEIEDLKRKLSEVIKENHKLKKELNSINLLKSVAPYIIE